MNDLEAIARDLHLPVENLKLPSELLRQGYDRRSLLRIGPMNWARWMRRPSLA